MGLVLFEDSHASQLSPAALARPVSCIQCGGYRLLDLLEELQLPARQLVRPHLRAIVAADTDIDPTPPAEDFTLFLNARLVPSAHLLPALQSWCNDPQMGVVRSGESIAAALVHAKVDETQFTGADSLEDYLDDQNLESRDLALPLFEYPHEIIKYHLEIFADNLAHRINRGGYQETESQLFLAPAAHIHPSATSDTSGGAIVLEAGATVGPHSHLRGPVLLGPDTQVLEQSAIKSHTSAGRSCKLGGEISCSIIESYSNKAHHGFLGHSYLGSWVNLGAGTTNSNLKNTYGEIQMRYGEDRIATGMQFVGCIVGDYTKTAINTSLFTGKTVGVCSMLYGFVTENVPSFVNYARQFGKATEMTPQVAATVQSRMFSRRGIKARECDAALLDDLYKLTAGERALFENNLPKEPLVF
jgi:glucose-1-phosphate thymidylyltransferase